MKGGVRGVEQSQLGLPHPGELLGPPLAGTRLSCTRETLIRFVSTSDKFAISNVVGVNYETLECAHFRFNKCPIKIYDDANVKFCTS